jgi:hypothetical protein
MRLIFALALSACAWGQTRESLEKQLKSVQQQLEAVRRMGSVFSHADTPGEADSACDPMSEEQVSPLIESAARAQALPAQLLRAVIAQESGFRSCAVSVKGAQGLMQLMPATAQELKVGDPFDPGSNIAGGAAFLRRLLEKYKGSLPEALGAYDAGSEAVDKAAGVPDISETRRYVDAIVGKMGIKRIELPPVPAAAKPIEPPKPVAPLKSAPGRAGLPP